MSVKQYYLFYLNQAKEQRQIGYGGSQHPYFLGHRFGTPYYQSGTGFFQVASRILTFLRSAGRFAKRQAITSAANIARKLTSAETGQQIKGIIKDSIKQEGVDLVRKGIGRLSEKLQEKKRSLDERDDGGGDAVPGEDSEDRQSGGGGKRLRRIAREPVAARTRARIRQKVNAAFAKIARQFALPKATA